MVMFCMLYNTDKEQNYSNNVCGAVIDQMFIVSQQRNQEQYAHGFSVLYSRVASLRVPSVCTWTIYPYFAGLLSWYRDNRKIGVKSYESSVKSTSYEHIFEYIQSCQRYVFQHGFLLNLKETRGYIHGVMGEEDDTFLAACPATRTTACI